jgi:hypothetical protein
VSGCGAMAAASVGRGQKFAMLWLQRVQITTS